MQIAARQRAEKRDAALKLEAVSLNLQFVAEWAIADDVELKGVPFPVQSSHGFEKDLQSLFLNEPADVTDP